MITVKLGYVAKCDNCQEIFPNVRNSFFETKNELLEGLIHTGWKLAQDGSNKVYCDVCICQELSLHTLLPVKVTEEVFG